MTDSLLHMVNIRADRIEGEAHEISTAIKTLTAFSCFAARPETDMRKAVWRLRSAADRLEREVNSLAEARKSRLESA